MFTCINLFIKTWILIRKLDILHTIYNLMTTQNNNVYLSIIMQ